MKERNPAVDIIRCLALFFVVSVHFMLNNGFYKQTVDGGEMFIMTLMRSLFIICVPLFLTLSGYLLRKKELTKRYFKRIFPILLTYVLTSIVCMLYSLLFNHEELSFGEAIMKILNFTGAPYSWYIKVYVRLFLLIPFLNILYNRLPSQKWKLGLISISLLICSAPSIEDILDFSFIFGGPAIKSARIIPVWISYAYPVSYYFVGCYFSEYKIKLRKSLNLLAIAVFVAIFALYSFWRSHNSTFISGTWGEYPSIFSAILSILVFNFIISFNYENFPKKLSYCFMKLSGLCLGAYLVSYIFDSLFYPILIRKVPVMTQRLWFYLIIVPIVYVTSLALSYVLSKIQKLLEIAFAKLLKIFKKNKAHV